MLTRFPVFVPSEEDEKELETFLDRELSDQQENRAVLHRKFRDWNKQYESIHEGEASFPWPKSANPKIGLTQYHVDTIFSIITNVMKVNKLPFTCKTYDRSLSGLLKSIEQFLQWSTENKMELNLYAAIEPCILEMIQLGTGIAKGTWEVREETARFFKNVPSALIAENARRELKRARSEDGSIRRSHLIKDVDTSRIELAERAIGVQRPKLTHVPLADFWFPMGYRNLRDMPWVAERFRFYSKQAFRRFAEDFDWPKDRIEKVSNEWRSAQEDRPELQETDQATGTREGIIDTNTFYEFWIEWKFKRDPLAEKKRKGKLSRWVVWYHHEARTILGAIPHPYNNGQWPFFDFHYQRRSGKFLSRGLCAMLESEEVEGNAIHKQRRDAATAANTVLGKANKNAGLTVENTTVWPNKIFFMEDPAKDLIFSTIGRELDIRGMLDEEKALLEHAGRKTGLTDMNFGKDMGSAGKGRASATAIMAALRENLRRFSKVLDNARETVSDIGQHTLELYHQHAPFGKVFTVLGEDGMPLEEFFFLPQVPLRGRLFVQCSVTTENMNEEVRRQALLLSTNMLEKYYKQMTELVTLVANPNAPVEVKEMAMQTAAGMTVMTEEFLEAFGIRRREELLVRFPKSINDLSTETAVQMIKQMVNSLKAKGATIELIDTTQAGQPPAPAALPASPLPLPQAGPTGGGAPAAAPPPAPAPAQT